MIRLNEAKKISSKKDVTDWYKNRKKYENGLYVVEMIENYLDPDEPLRQLWDSLSKEQKDIILYEINSLGTAVRKDKDIATQKEVKYWFIDQFPYVRKHMDSADMIRFKKIFKNVNFDLMNDQDCPAAYKKLSNKSKKEFTKIMDRYFLS